MNGKELLMGVGNINPRYYEEAETEAFSTRKRIRRPFLIAAILALTALLVGCAVAYALSVGDLKLGTYNHRMPRYIDTDGNKVPEAEITRDVISLQGIAGSPNFLAAREWFEFEQSYDPDHSLLEEVDNNPITVSSDYDAYFVYTQEMVNKIDEITQKYNLELAGEFAGFQSYEMALFFDALGIDALHREDTSIEYSHGYFYSCGNFQVGFLLNPDTDPVSGTFRYNGKGYFDTVFSSISGGETEEWTYTTSDGHRVLIVAGESGVQIFCNREDTFLSLHLHRNDLTKAEIEACADCFDFAVTPRKPDMVQVKEKLQESFEAYQKEQEGKYKNPFLHDDHSYDDIIRRCLENGIESYYYALRDITGDGEPELFLGCGDSFGDVNTIRDGKPTTLWSNGSDRDIQLCEGNILRYTNGQNYYYMKLDPVSGQFSQFLVLGYDLWEEQWYFSEGIDGEMQYISKEEYDRLEGTYPVVELGMKPIEAYPLS